MASVLQVAFLISLLASMVRIATPILLAALGELITERSGVLNLGVEGIMLTGALVGFLVTYYSERLWLATLAAVVAGIVLAFIIAVLAVSLKVDQIITGLSINLIATGLTTFGYRLAFKNVGTQNPATVPTYNALQIPLLSDIPFLGPVLFSQHFLTYFAILSVPLIFWFLYRTRYGLELRGIGDNPRALDMKGIIVWRYQYLAVLFGGAMAGLAGAFLTQVSTGIFVPQISAGRGWIAVAIVIFGNWTPLWVLIGSLFFGLVDSTQLALQAIGVKLPYQLLLSLPYVLTIVALIVNRMRSQSPLALGKPYSRETS
ncbi:MAG: ABC transporter permease [Anaerolineae bacterium]